MSSLEVSGALRDALIDLSSTLSLGSGRSRSDAGSNNTGSGDASVDPSESLFDSEYAELNKQRLPKPLRLIDSLCVLLTHAPRSRYTALTPTARVGTALYHRAFPASCSARVCSV